MNTKQLNAALKIAQDTDNVRFIDDNGQHLEDISMFDGYGLAAFKPIIVTLKQLAFLIRWQCLRFNGSIDNAELEGIAAIGRRKFTVIGQGA